MKKPLKHHFTLLFASWSYFEISLEALWKFITSATRLNDRAPCGKSCRVVVSGRPDPNLQVRRAHLQARRTPV